MQVASSVAAHFPDGKWTLPKEFSAIKLKSDHIHRPEVEITTEKQPDYGATKLKSNPKQDRDTKREAACSQRPSFERVELRKSIRSMNTTKDNEDPHGLPREFADVHLKRADPSTTRSPEVEVQAEELPEYTSVHLKHAAPVEMHKIEPRRGSYVDVQLKVTGHAGVLKSGGDVVKDAPSKDAHINSLLSEFGSVHLKKSDPSNTRPAEIELLQHEQPEYTSIKLKTAAPIEKHHVEARRASYADLQLKQSDHGAAVKSGMDVTKKEPEDPSKHVLGGEFNSIHLKNTDTPTKAEVELPPDVEPEYSAFQLKVTSQGDAVKSGKDVEGHSKVGKAFTLPKEFFDVHLKKPVGRAPEV